MCAPLLRTPGRSLPGSLIKIEGFGARSAIRINDQRGYLGLLIYIAFLSSWTMLGLSTMPIETVAGMAFGMKKGLSANAIGRISGAVLAYIICHRFLEDYVIARMGDSDLFELVQSAVAEKPFRTTLLVRFAPIPELAKNLGLSILPEVDLWVLSYGLAWDMTRACD